MTDRDHVKKAADAGVGKAVLLKDDPLRYMMRAVGAGMGLTLIVFVFWVLKHNLNDISIGAVIASGFFGVGLMIIVFTNTELFTSNNMYLTVSSVEGRTSWRQTTILWMLCYLGNLAGAILLAALLVGAGSLGQLPPDHALFDGALHKAHQAGSVIFFKGILANWIVCLAVRVALRCKEEVAKILVLVLIVFTFVYLGIRTFNRQYGNILYGDSWRRHPNFERSAAQPPLQHRWKRAWRSGACRLALHLSQSTRA